MDDLFCPKCRKSNKIYMFFREVNNGHAKAVDFVRDSDGNLSLEYDNFEIDTTDEWHELGHRCENCGFEGDTEDFVNELPEVS